MPRQPEEWRHVRAAADRIEPRLARAVERGAERLKKVVTIDEIALSLATGDVRRVMRLFPKNLVEEAFAPAGTIGRDTTVIGGRLGARILNKARRE